MPVQYLGTRDVPVAELTPFPGNARRGNPEAIAESLALNGQFRSVVVRDTGTGLVILAGNHTTQGVSLLAALSPAELQTRYGAKIQAAIGRAEAQEAEARANATAATDEDRETFTGHAELAAAQAAAHRAALAGLASWSGRTSIRAELVKCDDQTAHRINLADNRTADLGTYDDQALSALLNGLDGDFEGTGYDAEQAQAAAALEFDEWPPLPEPAARPPSPAGPPDGPGTSPAGTPMGTAELVLIMTGEEAAAFHELTDLIRGHTGDQPASRITLEALRQHAGRA